MVKEERGSALLVALVTVLVVTMSMLLVASFIDVRKLSFEIEERNVTISALADAAMAETLANLSKEKYFKGVVERDFGGGSISSTVTIEKNDHRRVVAVGKFKRWTASIDAKVSVQTTQPFVVKWSYHQGPN